MHALDTFVREWMQAGKPDMNLIKQMLTALKEPAPPGWEQAAGAPLFSTSFHGIDYDYEKEEVHISYRAVEGLYEETTVSFAVFYILLEGLSVVLRRHHW